MKCKNCGCQIYSETICPGCGQPTGYNSGVKGAKAFKTIVSISPGATFFFLTSINVLGVIYYMKGNCKELNKISHKETLLIYNVLLSKKIFFCVKSI